MMQVALNVNASKDLLCKFVLHSGFTSVCEYYISSSFNVSHR